MTTRIRDKQVLLRTTSDIVALVKSLDPLYKTRNEMLEEAVKMLHYWHTHTRKETTMGISLKAINEAIELGRFVEEQGRITDPANMEEWANEVELEATERGYNPEMVAEMGLWIREEASWTPR